MGSRSTKYGGVEKFMVGLIRNNKELTFHLVYNEYPKSEKYVEELQQLGVSIHVINVLGKGIIYNLPKFYRLVKLTHPVIVHFHFSSVHALWAPICKWLGVNTIFHTTHCCAFSNNKNADSINDMGIAHRILMQWGRVFKLYNSNLCVSNYVMQQTIKVYGDYGNNRVIYLGTDIPPAINDKKIIDIKNKWNITDGTQILLTVLFADPIKGCDILIKALPHIKADYRLIIVGMDESSPYTRRMHELAKELHVEDKIIWTGVTDKVHDYMSIADIFVQPSRSEALSLAAVEAMSHALPVVASNVGGLPEVANILFEYEDHKKMADILTELIHNPDKCKVFGQEQAERWNSLFSLSNGIKQYSELYNNKNRTHV